MNSFRIASLAAAFAFGLVGFARTGLAETVSSYDPSTSYQPSPNHRAAVVSAPVTLTSATFGAQAPRVVPSVTAPTASNYEPSPNARPAAQTVTVAVRPTSNKAEATASFYQPSPNVRPAVAVAPNRVASEKGRRTNTERKPLGSRL